MCGCVGLCLDVVPYVWFDLCWLAWNRLPEHGHDPLSSSSPVGLEWFTLLVVRCCTQ